jgi:hypothetical protein
VPEAEKAGGEVGLRELQLTTSDHFAARTARERQLILAWLITARRARDSVEELQTSDSQAERRLDSMTRTASGLPGSRQSAAPQDREFSCRVFSCGVFS